MRTIKDSKYIMRQEERSHLMQVRAISPGKSQNLTCRRESNEEAPILCGT